MVVTRGRFETAEKVVFRKKLKIFRVLKCIIKQEMGLRSNSGGPFFYDYIDVLKKWTFSVISDGSCADFGQEKEAQEPHASR